MFSKTTNRVHPSGSWKVLLVLQIGSLEHSRNATLNDGQVSGGSNGNVPHRTPDPYYYYLTISEYLVICCWPCSINTFDFIFGCFFGYFCCCFSEILRYASFELLLIHSILRKKMRNVKYTCLMQVFLMRSAVLCNDFQPWEKPWQHTCKTTIIFWIVQSAKYKVEFKVCNKTLIGRTNNSNRTMNALQGKFQMSMTKSVIKCRFLPLNVDSFFEFKLKSCGSMI